MHISEWQCIFQSGILMYNKTKQYAFTSIYMVTMTEQWPLINIYNNWQIKLLKS